LRRGSLFQARKRGATLAINEYQTIEEKRKCLVDAGFQIESIRMCRLSANDLLFLGLAKSYLKPLMPLRIAFISLFGWFEGLAGKSQVLNPLFREIVILAKKRT